MYAVTVTFNMKDEDVCQHLVNCYLFFNCNWSALYALISLDCSESLLLIASTDLSLMQDCHSLFSNELVSLVHPQTNAVFMW
jgi:hypothetical protein